MHYILKNYAAVTRNCNELRDTLSTTKPLHVDTKKKRTILQFDKKIRLLENYKRVKAGKQLLFI